MIVYFRNWWRGPQPATEPAIPVESTTLKNGLSDMQRIGLSVWLAPDGIHAVVADNLGRVMLIDCVRGIAVRVWKGYREAQCSFIPCTEKLKKKSKTTFDETIPRQALFLVIFAPRRSCIEIWGLQRGPKIAAFNASKYGKLIYTPHFMMGRTATTVVSTRHTISTCLFFDPTDQSFKEIYVPFHCAINDENSKTAKDVHLLRRIKLCLRSSGNNDSTEDLLLTEIRLLCSYFQTDELRFKCIEMMMRNDKVTPTILDVAIFQFKAQVALEEHEMMVVNESKNEEEDEENELNYNDDESIIKPEISYLQCTLKNVGQLVEFYLYVTGIKKPSACRSNKDILFEPISIHLSETELEYLQKFIDLTVLYQSQQKSIRAVTFDDSIKSNRHFIEYLAIFKYGDDEQEEDVIYLKEEMFKKFSDIGYEIFSEFLEKGTNLNDFTDYARESGILINDLMRLLLFYWLEKPFEYTKM